MINIHTFLGGKNFSDEEIADAISLMEDFVKIYCNITQIRDDMYYIILAMAAGFLLEDGDVKKRISMGDVSIENFEKKDKFTNLLNRFRRCF